MADISDVMKKLDKQDTRLERIEITMSTVATQSVQITALQEQTSLLFKKHNDAFAIDGPVAVIKTHQASCPRKEFSRMWGTIAGLVTIDIAILGWIFKMGIKS